MGLRRVFLEGAGYRGRGGGVIGEGGRGGRGMGHEGNGFLRIMFFYTSVVGFPIYPFLMLIASEQEGRVFSTAEAFSNQ